MRKVDVLVIEYPDIYKCIGETNTDKTYKLLKSFASYRKSRKSSDEQREAARGRVKMIN